MQVIIYIEMVGT